MHSAGLIVMTPDLLIGAAQRVSCSCPSLMRPRHLRVLGSSVDGLVGLIGRLSHLKMPGQKPG